MRLTVVVAAAALSVAVPPVAVASARLGAASEEPWCAIWFPTPATPTPAATTAAAVASLPQPPERPSDSIGACVAALPRKRSNSGNGSRPATFAAARLRSGTCVRIAASRPAASASRRHGWQCDRWRARRRESRVAQAGAGGRGDQALDPHAARAADEVVVLLGQAPARAEQRALDGRAAHAHPVADLAVGEAFELAQDEDLVVRVGQAAERAAQVVELLLGRDGVVGRRVGADEPAVVARGEAVVGLVARPPRRAWSAGTASMQAFLAIS